MKQPKFFLPKQRQIRQAILANDGEETERLFKDALVNSPLFRQTPDGLWLVDQRTFKARKPSEIKGDALVEHLALKLRTFFIIYSMTQLWWLDPFKRITKAVATLDIFSHMFVEAGIKTHDQTIAKLKKNSEKIVVHVGKEIRKQNKELASDLTNVFLDTIPLKDFPFLAIRYAVAMILSHFGLDDRPVKKIDATIKMDISRRRI
jgi:hypothetical protein